MNARILVDILEVAFFVFAVWSLLCSPTKTRPIDLTLFCVAAVVCALAAVRSDGFYGVATIFKVASFFLMVRLAVDRPFLAIRFLTVATVVYLIVEAFDGEILTKYSAWPFLLWCGCLLFGRRTSSRVALTLLSLAILLEVIQSIYVDGRGLLINSVLVVLLSALRHGWYRHIWRLFARVAPVLYPIALLFVLLSIARGDDYVQSTASNVERSTLAFWCITLMPDFVLNGPGPDYFFENVNAALATAGRERNDEGIDPHSFLLSYWVGLGMLAMLVIYIAWWRIWSRFAAQNMILRYHERIVASIFSASSIMIFTLVPPDGYARVACGLCVGLALRAFDVLPGHRTAVVE